MEVSNSGATAKSREARNARSNQCSCSTCCAEYWLLWVFLTIFYVLILLVMAVSKSVSPFWGYYASILIEWNILSAVFIVTIVKDCCICCKGTPKLEQSKQEQPKQEQRRKSGSSRMFWLVITDYRVVAAVETSWVETGFFYKSL